MVGYVLRIPSSESQYTDLETVEKRKGGGVKSGITTMVSRCACA